jgi:hypothetical protein
LETNRHRESEVGVQIDPLQYARIDEEEYVGALLDLIVALENAPQQGQVP